MQVISPSHLPYVIDSLRTESHLPFKLVPPPVYPPMTGQDTPLPLGFSYESSVNYICDAHT